MKLYTLKVSLTEIKGIWRWIEITENCTFDELHNLLFQAYDREEEHLYNFLFPREDTTSFMKIYDSPLDIQHPFLYEDCMEDPDHNIAWETRGLPPPVIKSTDKTKIKDSDLKEKESFYYCFDMGDTWWHKIRVEKIEETSSTKKVKQITKRRGDSPPQYKEYEEEERA